MPRRCAARAAAIALALGALACAGKGVQVSEYVLTADATGSGVAAPRELMIGVGPVRLPRYLRRVELATRSGPNQVRYADEHRWGEALDKGLARVVARNLALLVPASRVATFPWREIAELDYRVAIEVERFEASADGSVVLAARWTLQDRSSKQLLSHRADIRKESGGKDSAAKVATMSLAAEELSREIAAAIRSKAGFASR